MNGVQTRFKCKLDVKRCKRFVFPPSSLLPRSNALKTKAIRYFQTDRTLTRIVSPPLIPYIVEQSRKAIASGAPLLQALIFHHPEDKLCWHIDDEYYFGNDFLVAPVMNSENRRDVYLPEGKWVNFFTGERLEGGRWLKNLDVPLDEMPVYVRQGATIPVYPDEVECTDDMDLSKSIGLHIDPHFKGIFKN